MGYPKLAWKILGVITHAKVRDLHFEIKVVWEVRDGSGEMLAGGKARTVDEAKRAAERFAAKN